MEEDREAYLDITLIECPSCGKLYVDASWYIIDMESDIECGICGETFNTRKNIVRRLLLKISIKGEEIKLSAKDISVEDKD